MIWLHFRQPDGSYHLIKVLSELAESYHRWYDTPATSNIKGPGVYERNAEERNKYFFGNVFADVLLLRPRPPTWTQTPRRGSGRGAGPAPAASTGEIILLLL